MRSAAKAETSPTGPGSRDAKDTETSSAREFEDLRQKRRAILDELSQLSQSRLEQQRTLNQYQDKKVSLTTNIESINAKIATFNVEQFKCLRDEAQNDKVKLKNNLADEERKSPPDQTVIQKLTTDIQSNENLILYDQGQIDEYDKTVKDKEQKQEQLDATDKDISKNNTDTKDNDAEINKKTEELQDFENKITVFLTQADQENSFKLDMSFVFLGLVLIVIFGFFAVAFKDENVRKSIFSSESGIQFITLFSLVIAIILFGIINILEGRELAALLGGLSGYILGRGSKPT
jgi:hypothetical protein